MTKKFIAFALLAATTIQMSARERSETEIFKAAANAIGNMPTMTGKLRATQPMRVLARNSELSVVGYAEGGFALVANDDVFKPVFGYSDSKYDGNAAPAFLWYVQSLNASLAEAKATGNMPKQVMPSAAYKESVPEIMTCRWGQDAPYNLFTPTYTDRTTGQKVNYVTGCVATAMAQILYTHKYPVKGEGDIIYDFAPGGGEPSQTLETDFSANTYDWANMLDIYKEGQYTETQGKAVATIMRDCGYAVRMQYTKDGSGAFTTEACRALRTYLGCNQWIRHFYRDIINIDEWMDMIYRELNDGCPVLYGGQSTSGGHCFVIDGYDANGMVHVNWGWDGSQDGFFDIVSLNGYNAQQSFVEVRPATDTRYVGKYKSLWGLNDDLIIDSGDNYITVNQVWAYNYDVEEFTGTILLQAENTETGKIVKLADVQRAEARPSLGYQSIGQTSVFTNKLSNGTWRIYLASKADAEDEAQPLRTNENHCNSYLVTIRGGEIAKCDAEQNSNWTAIDNVPTANNDAESTGVSVYNTLGNLVYRSANADFNINDVPATGVLMVKKGCNVTKIVKK